MGTKGVSVCEASKDGTAVLHDLTNDSQWLKDSIHVFDGNFTVESDKSDLVDTVLGLYSLVLSERHSGGLLGQLIADDKDNVSLMLK